MPNSSNFTITIDGGGSSSGARRVCSDLSDPEHVDIGDMSRNWKSSEATLLDDDYTWECVSSKLRVTQIQVGTDGLAVVVGKDSQAHDCLTNPEVGGLTLAMLHWIYTDWTDAQLADYGLDLASVLPNDDGDGVKEWSDLSAACPEVPINAYGPGSDSGTTDFFAEATLCKACFNGDDGFDPEDFNWCPSGNHSALEQLTTAESIASFMRDQRPVNCYMSSESDYQLLQWLAADSGGIAYFGYGYFTTFAGQLTVARIASDPYLSVKDTADAKVEPSTYTITDGSYSVYTRRLFMNVDNHAWARVQPYLEYGFSPEGQTDVRRVGYVAVNAALLAKMKIRIAEEGNDEADYVSVAPDQCLRGTELSAVPYVNQFGNNKVNYTCTPCREGQAKFLDTPTACLDCEAGRYTDQRGQSACSLCALGHEAVNGTECQACTPGSYKSEAAAASCSPCAPGQYSNQSAQSECVFCGPGFFAPRGSSACEACPLNTFAAVPGSGSCSSCPEGFVASQAGATACDRCRAGSYRSAEPQCVQCPDAKTTAFQGAVLVGDCICPAGQYLQDGLQGSSLEAMASGTCVDCGEGLDCGLGSDLRVYDRFLAGAPLLPEDQLFPLLEPGYYAPVEDPTKVYKCGALAFCPGGLPGVCAEGRVEIPCGRCRVGTKFEGGRCRDCSAMDNLLFFSGTVFLAVSIPIFYYFMNSPMTAKASTMLSTAMAFGMTTLLQTVGLVGLVSLNWPSYMQPLLDFVSIFMLDLESLNFDCVGVPSSMRYIASVLCWPAAMVWLVVCGFLSRLGPRKYHFGKAKALSTLGQLFQIGFTIIAKTALMPFMCYSHPNGLSSVLRFSDVICWASDAHTTMVIFGGLMTAIMAVYWAVLLWCTLQAPKKSAQADLFFLQATRFLFFRFRTDYWWYGCWFILRGPLLSLPVVIFTDLPQVQLFIMTAVLETYMVMQLMTWPWKTPLINLADGAMSMMMILLLSIGAAFLDALEGQVKATYSSLAVAVLGILYSIAFVLLSLVLVALVHKTAMGSANELPILTLGKPPSDESLRHGLDVFHTTYEERDGSLIDKAIEELNVYDRRMLAAVLTSLGSYLSDDKRMRLTSRLFVSTISVASNKPSDKAEDPQPAVEEEKGQEDTSTEEEEKGQEDAAGPQEQEQWPAPAKSGETFTACSWKEQLQSADV